MQRRYPLSRPRQPAYRDECVQGPCRNTGQARTIASDPHERSGGRDAGERDPEEPPGTLPVSGPGPEHRPGQKRREDPRGHPSRPPAPRKAKAYEIERERRKGEEDREPDPDRTH